MKKVFRELISLSDASIIVKQEQAKQFAAPFHFHHGYEFTMIVKGHGKFYGGEKLMNFAEDEVYFFGPGFPHYFINDKTFIQSENLAHSIIVQFGEDFLGREFFLKPELKAVRKLLKNAQFGIKLNNQNERIKTIFYELTYKKGVKTLLLLIELLDIISELKKGSLQFINSYAYKPGSNPGDFKKLEIVYQYVLENFKEEVNIKNACSLAFMNESAFCRYFKRRTKKTFSQFVNNVRITHASYLLEEKDISIGDVCFQCGFNNLSYFNRQFKFIKGLAPFDYRKRILESDQN